MAKKTVRILRQQSIDGVSYEPNQLVAFEKATADQYVEAGAADDNKAGIAHCKEQGAELITHGEAATNDAKGTSSDDEASGD